MNHEHLFYEIEERIRSFESISLQEMNEVKLMDRTDVKYLIPLNLLPDILEEAYGNYKLMEVDNIRISAYETLYYDTPDLKLYHMHHRGKNNRYKIRSRNYVDSGLKFFEIKFKNNKGRTIKTRIAKDEIETEIDSASSEFLSSTTPLNPVSLSGIMWVDYERITLVHKSIPERVTIDLRLSFRNGSRQKDYPSLVIAEVKQEKLKGSPFIDIMRKFRLQKGSISKYCFGIISLFEGVKQNSFKPGLQKLNKIICSYDRIHSGIHSGKPVSVV